MRELAGSGELNKVTQEPAGAVGTGTRLLAEETVKFADGHGMDVTADSVVVTFDPPKAISWIANPVLPDRLRRVQWWFELFPAGDGTHVGARGGDRLRRPAGRDAEGPSGQLGAGAG